MPSPCRATRTPLSGPLPSAECLPTVLTPCRSMARRPGFCSSTRPKCATSPSVVMRTVTEPPCPCTPIAESLCAACLTVCTSSLVVTRLGSAAGAAAAVAVGVAAAAGAEGAEATVAPVTVTSTSFPLAATSYRASLSRATTMRPTWVWPSSNWAAVTPAIPPWCTSKGLAAAVTSAPARSTTTRAGPESLKTVKVGLADPWMTILAPPSWGNTSTLVTRLGAVPARAPAAFAGDAARLPISNAAGAALRSIKNGILSLLEMFWAQATDPSERTVPGTRLP